jgi:hypothetical protein
MKSLKKRNYYVEKLLVNTAKDVGKVLIEEYEEFGFDLSDKITDSTDVLIKSLDPAILKSMMGNKLIDELAERAYNGDKVAQKYLLSKGFVAY